MDENERIADQPAEGPPAEDPQNDSRQPDARAPDPRRRLRELLAVPERDRSDAVWDEIIELEIQLAPGNRAASQQAQGGRNQEAGRRPGAMPQQDRAFGGKPGKRFAKQSKHRPGRRPRPTG